jgi:hypothetical protein
MLWIAVLQPEDARRDVRRHVLDIRHDGWFLAVRRHEDLDGFIVIADGTGIERTLHATDCNPPNARASASKSPTKFAHPSPRGLGRIVVEQKSFVISGDSAQPFDQLPIAGLADG